MPDIPAGAVPAGSLTDDTDRTPPLVYTSLSGSNYTFALPDGWNAMSQDKGEPQTLTLHDADSIPLLEK
ncbi:hypothetical protein Barb6XT_01349 [Bacteroidales bacterium Barb6XT]|nr:hypothetical protein Barb6XT_01349 [Bacteroidales bacterium Barb6XT]